MINHIRIAPLALPYSKPVVPKVRIVLFQIQSLNNRGLSS